MPHAVTESTTDNLSFQILDGSVVVTPSKAFMPDSSRGESDSSLTNEDTYNSEEDDLDESKYVRYTLEVYISVLAWVEVRLDFLVFVDKDDKL